jgi:hypothetical protein
MTSLDSDYVADRYVTKNGIPWYQRQDIGPATPTECMICLEAERQKYTLYSHPRAHNEAHSIAEWRANDFASIQNKTQDFLDYYTFFYGREYKKLYMDLYKKYREEYHIFLLRQIYGAEQVCQYHLESIQYHAHYVGQFQQFDSFPQ